MFLRWLRQRDTVWRHRQEHLKYKLGMELDNLDVLAEDYDDEYEAVQSKIDEVYDRIEILEESIRKLKKRMEALKKGVCSSDNIQKILAEKWCISGLFVRLVSLEKPCGKIGFLV